MDSQKMDYRAPKLIELGDAASLTEGCNVVSQAIKEPANAKCISAQYQAMQTGIPNRKSSRL
jgi:hypothetical protein